VSSLAEISVVPQQPQVGDPDERLAAIPMWSPVEIVHTARPTPTTLVVLAVCAGVGALVLGGLAGVSTISRSESTAQAPPPATADPAGERALALLAKPSTERVVFRGSGGSLVLAVGSGGRAAILMRGFERPSTARPYAAWVVGSGSPIRAARLNGTERAVFLDIPLAPHESVVVARKQPGRITSATPLLARRG
jgi:hypothetical protein